MAEGVGFEPTDPYGSPVFKTGALNRSAIPPISSRCLIRELSLSFRAFWLSPIFPPSL
jgi:hypothetical protein